MMLHLRRNLPFYDVVEEFRESLAVTRMPELSDSITEKVIQTTLSLLKDIFDLYPRQYRRGDNHYVQLINHRCSYRNCSAIWKRGA